MLREEDLDLNGFIFFKRYIKCLNRIILFFCFVILIAIYVGLRKEKVRKNFRLRIEYVKRVERE